MDITVRTDEPTDNVIDFVLRKVLEEVKFIANYCSDAGLMRITSQEVINEHWARIFSMADNIRATEEEKDVIFQELSDTYDVNQVLIYLSVNQQ